MADGLVGRSELAARRLIAVGASVVVLIVSGVAIVLARWGGELALPRWFAGLAAVVAIWFVVAGIMAPWLGERALRATAIVSLAGYATLLVAFFPAQDGHPEIDRMPWLLSPTVPAVAVALLAGGRRAAWSALAIGVVAAVAYRVGVGGLDLDGVVNDTHAALSATIVCVVAAQVIDASRALDAAGEATAQATRTVAAERGRAAARARAGALVHDEVLAVLNLAAADLPVPRDRLAAAAERAGTMVASLAREDTATRPLAAVLREAAETADAEFTVHGDIPSLADEVVAALAAATRQALENSVRHAGQGARRTLTMTGAPEEVTLEISDDGVGFDPAAVGSDRLGVRGSIVGRLREVPGAHARVESAPGAGTRVVLTWHASTVRDLPGAAPSAPDAGVAALQLAALESGRGAAHAASERALRIGLTVIAIEFVVGLVLCAVVAGVTTGAWASSLGVLTLAIVAAEVLRRSPGDVPGRARLSVLLALVAGTVLVGLAGTPFSYSSTWGPTVGAFMLVALAFRGRPVVALVGAGAIIGVGAYVGAVAGAAPIVLATVLVRPIIVVVLAVGLLVTVEWMQRRTAHLHHRAIATARSLAWSEAAREESAVRAAELERRVMPMLARIRAATPLTPAERRTCAGLEGELRDEYRAGRLVQEPLVSAAGRARRRGVDVVLLDDAADATVDDLERIVAWMARGADSAHARLVGRLHPGGRAAVATATVDGVTTKFTAHEP